MNSYFEVKLKYTKVTESGAERRVIETYLVDAVSFTEAEARITQEADERSLLNFEVKGITESRIENVLTDEGEWSWKAKISYNSIDEVNGREKRINSTWLTFADDITEALIQFEKTMDDIVVKCKVESVALSSIVEVLPYTSETPN